ncbi:GatB/YqeY domain-containing protein [soil metagenome]
MKDAMRARAAERLGTLRMLRAAFIEHDKSGKGPVTEEDATTIVQRLVKQRKESARQFDEADRPDLADKERSEAAILEAYLPEQLSDEEIRRRVEEIAASSGASSPADMGRVMGPAMASMRGQADGGRVRAIVQEVLKS